jgi:hypothetical protein
MHAAQKGQPLISRDNFQNRPVPPRPRGEGDEATSLAPGTVRAAACPLVVERTLKKAFGAVYELTPYRPSEVVSCFAFASGTTARDAGTVSEHHQPFHVTPRFSDRKQGQIPGGSSLM